MKYTVDHPKKILFSIKVMIKSLLFLIWTCLIIVASMHDLTLTFFGATIVFGLMGFILFGNQGKDSVQTPIITKVTIDNNKSEGHYLSIFAH